MQQLLIKPAGNYKVNFDANTLTSGVCFYKLHVTSDEGSCTNTKEMVLLK